MTETVERVNARISGIGICIPDAVLTNEEVGERTKVAADWIYARTGIRERHVAAPEQATSDLAVKAAQRAIEDAGIKSSDVDLIVLATMSPDAPLPATACSVQEQLGMKSTPAFDVVAGCSGFIYGLITGAQFIMSRLYKTILVIGAEVLTRVTDWGDTDTCIVVGDAAGAVVLRPAGPDQGILSMCLGADGSGIRFLHIPAGGSRMPVTVENVASNMHKVKMNGQEVFQFAMKMLPEVTEKALKLAGLSIEDVALIVPHQANVRIIEAAARRMDLPMDKFFVNLERYGNTSAASVPIALKEAMAEGRIKPGDVVVLAGFGAGLTWGAAVVRW